MRVYEFAKEFDKESGDFLQELRFKFGFKIKSHLSTISKEQMIQVRLEYNLEIQIDDSHKEDVEKTFNTTEEKTDKWTLGSGDAIPLETKNEPEFISYDLVKDEEETKKIEESIKKDEESMIKTAEHARKEYAKTVHNITEKPDDWHIVTPKKDASSLVLEDISEEEKIEERNESAKGNLMGLEREESARAEHDISIHKENAIKVQEVIIEQPSWWSKIFSWWLGT